MVPTDGIINITMHRYELRTDSVAKVTRQR